MRPSLTTIVSASSSGLSMSPDSMRPTLRITTLPDLPAAATSAIEALLGFGVPQPAAGASTGRERAAFAGAATATARSTASMMKPRQYAKACGVSSSSPRKADSV